MRRGSGRQVGLPGRHDEGATVVEFALVAPLLFLLLFGVVEFGRGIATYTAVTTAAREGARYGTTVGEDGDPIPPYEDCDGIRQAAFAKTPMLEPAQTSVDVSYDNGSDCPAGGSPGAAVQHGDRIIVTVETSFSSAIPLISNLIGGIEMSSTQLRTIYPGSDA